MLGGNAVRTSSFKSIITTIVSLLAILALILILVGINNNKEKTIEVTRAKEDIYTNFLITEESLEKYAMPYGEYSSSGNEYLLWSEREEATNKYASVFTKKGLYIIKGDYNPTKPIKNEWLSEIDEDKLIVNIPYDKGEAFGNILTPGDYVKVNISYMEQTTDTSGGFANTLNKQKRETLFTRVKILDMLNSSGNSIYDYYMDLLAMPVSERAKLLRDDSFLNNVSPTDILLEVGSTDEFDALSDKRGYSSLKYTFGLYKRIEEDTVLEQFRDLTRQITTAQTTNASDSKGTTKGAK